MCLWEWVFVGFMCGILLVVCVLYDFIYFIGVYVEKYRSVLMWVFRFYESECSY